MSGDSGQLQWQSIDPARVMPDSLSRIKSYNELDDESLPLVTPQPLQVRSRDDSAGPYFGSSPSEEAEEFSNTSFLPSESSSESNSASQPFRSVINQSSAPNASSASPFFTSGSTSLGPNGSPHLAYSPQGDSGAARFLPMDDSGHSESAVESIPFSPSERSVSSAVTLSPTTLEPGDDRLPSDFSANKGNYLREFLNSAGYTRLRESVEVDTYSSPAPRVQSAKQCPLTEKGEPTQKSPTEFVILAEKYILMGALDPSTIFAVHKDSREYFHVKSVPVRTAHEVVCQHALLQDYSGVRSPVEVVNSTDGRKAWLVFPPHYGDLHSYVRRRRRLRETEAQRLLNQIVSIVDRCHEAGLVLRDLKLRKFVFCDSSRQEIILESLEDSVFTGESDILHDKHGCPAYVAPEILTLSNFSGRLADMWGLGVILYTMLVGRYPFHNADTATLFAKIRNGKYSIPEWVSTRARHLILSLLRRQPARRLSTKQVLCHPWLIRPPREHWIRDTMDHVVPTEMAKTVSTTKKI